MTIHGNSATFKTMFVSPALVTFLWLSDLTATDAELRQTFLLQIVYLKIRVTRITCDKNWCILGYNTFGHFSCMTVSAELLP